MVDFVQSSGSLMYAQCAFAVPNQLYDSINAVYLPYVSAWRCDRDVRLFTWSLLDFISGVQGTRPTPIELELGNQPTLGIC